MDDDLNIEAWEIYNDFLTKLQSAADLPDADLRKLFDSLSRRFDDLPDELALKLLEFVEDIHLE